MAGSNPTFASCWDQAGLVLKHWNTVELLGNSATPNIASMEDAATVAIDGVYMPAALAAIAALRVSLASVLRPEAIASAWRQPLREMCRAVGLNAVTSGSNEQMLFELRQYMVDNNLSIGSRRMTFATPTADGGNVFNGDLFRVTVDKDGYPLSTGAEAKKAKCLQDALSGTQLREEAWLFEGSPVGKDALTWEGSGFSVQVKSAHTLSGRIVKNPSFDTNGVSADDTAPGSTTAISGWTVTSTAAFKLRSAAGYSFSTYPGAPTTGYGLQFVLDGTISQTIKTANPGAQFSSTRPHFLGVRYQRKASATGNLTFRVGAKTVVKTIGSASNDAWNWAYIPLDESCYLQNFNQTDLVVSIQVASLATGTVVVDHVTVVEMVPVDGTYYLPVSGSTPALKDDLFTWTDQENATRAILAYLLWRAFGASGWLPTRAPATQVTAAGGRTLTFADANPDTVTASSGSFVSDGYYVGMTLTVAGTSSNNGTFTITVVTATVITVSGSFAAEGPLSATATLNAAAPLPDPS